METDRDDGYQMAVGLEQKIVRMSREQIDEVVARLIADEAFVASVHDYMALVAVYIAGLHPDIAEDLEKRPNAEYFQRIKEEVLRVTGDREASAVFSSRINKEIVGLLQRKGTKNV